MISIRSLGKTFQSSSGRVEALRNVDLDVQKGEFVTVFGPNGSGKTTLLNIIAGIEDMDEGEVRVEGKDPAESRAGFVFQDYNESLFPWRTAEANISFPLEIRGVPKEERKRSAVHLLSRVGLQSLKDRYIYQLSGGQKQLVSICRAIIADPDILLMDEPFSALDYATTRKMELELLRVWSEKKVTTIFVSHDIDEAVFLADRIVVFSERPGKVQYIYDVPLPRPRTLDMLSSDTFIALRNEVLNTISL